MNITQLRELLTKDIVTVTFTKKDGSRREMVCTTIEDYLPEVTEARKEPSPTLVTVWDLEIQEWRSFKFDSVTAIETEYFNYVVER